MKAIKLLEEFLKTRKNSTKNWCGITENLEIKETDEEKITEWVFVVHKDTQLKDEHLQDILYNLSVATSEEELPTVNFTVKELKTLLYILEEFKLETKKDELKNMIEQFQEKIRKEI